MQGLVAAWLEYCTQLKSIQVGVLLTKLKLLKAKRKKRSNVAWVLGVLDGGGESAGVDGAGAE